MSIRLTEYGWASCSRIIARSRYRVCGHWVSRRRQRKQLIRNGCSSQRARRVRPMECGDIWLKNRILSIRFQESAFYLTGAQDEGHPDGGVNTGTHDSPGQVGPVRAKCRGVGYTIK